MGLTLGIRGGGISSVESQSGTSTQLPRLSHTHSQVQPAWAAGVAIENNAEIVMIAVMRMGWTVGVTGVSASESRGELSSGLDFL